MESSNFSFETEIVKNRNKWFSVAKSYYPNDIQSAEDLVSEVIEKILKNKDKFEIGTNFSAWGFNILRNTFINNYRRHIIRGAELELDSEHCVNIMSVDADTNIREADILAYINDLPKDFKSVFNEYLLGYKYEEIAEKFNTPIGTIKSRIHAARSILQKRITIEYNKTKNIIPSTENTMSSNAIDKTSNLKSLYKALFDLCTANNNNWISVQDCPLTPIYKQHGLDHNWGVYIMITLTNCDEFKVDGNKSTVKYRSCGGIEPNFDKLVSDTLRYKQEYNEERKNIKINPTEPRKYIRKTDTYNSQLQRTKPIVVPKSDKVIGASSDSHMNSIKKLLFSDNPQKTHYNPEDLCYVIYNGKIVEMEVVGVYRKDGIYYHDLQNVNDHVNVTGKLVSDLHESPESLCGYLLKVYRTDKNIQNNER